MSRKYKIGQTIKTTSMDDDGNYYTGTIINHGSLENFYIANLVGKLTVDGELVTFKRNGVILKDSDIKCAIRDENLDLI